MCRLTLPKNIFVNENNLKVIRERIIPRGLIWSMQIQMKKKLSIHIADIIYNVREESEVGTCLTGGKARKEIMAYCTIRSSKHLLLSLWKFHICIQCTLIISALTLHFQLFPETLPQFFPNSMVSFLNPFNSFNAVSTCIHVGPSAGICVTYHYSHP